MIEHIHHSLSGCLARLPARLLQRRSLIVPAIAVLLTACATQAPPQNEGSPKPVTPAVSASPQEQETLGAVVALQERLDRVSAPLLLSNVDLCRKQERNLLGFTAKNRHSYTSDLSNAAQKIYGLDEQLQVVSVMAGSGAARQGLRRGDILLAVEDKSMPQGPNAERQAVAVLAPLMTGRSSVKLTVLRNGSNISLNIPFTRACGFRIELGNADNVNSYGDGMRVLITRGMMNFIRSDNELAYVIAKELAHNALGHADRLKMKATLSDIIDNLTRVRPDTSMLGGTAGVKTMPPDLDQAADALSLYMLARAGYNIDQAVPFWRRLGEKYPATVLNSHTALHPATPQRLAVMEKIIKIVKTKQAEKKPLLP